MRPTPQRPQGISEGLLALSRETRDAQARTALWQLSQSVASGASLPQAIVNLPTAPAHLASLLRAAGERGAYALTLAQIAAGEHRARRLGKTAVHGLVYPLLLLLACAALTLAFGIHVLGPLHELLTEFELRLPRYVGRMQVVTIWGSVLILTIAGVGCIVALGFRLFGGRRGWGWFVTHLPLIGRNHHWASVIEWLELLRLLTAAGRPLPEALREAGQGVPDAYVGQASNRVAQRVNSGLPLWQAYSQEAALPASLWPFLRAGEEHGSLPAALENCETLLYGRLEMRVQMQDRWVPVLIICLAAMLITWIVMGVLSPMLGLIRGLGSGPAGGGFGDPSFDTLLMAVLLIPGMAVLLSRRILHRRGVSQAGKQVDPLLGTIGFLLIAAGLTGLIIAVSGGIVIVPVVITLVVASDALIFTRRCQHRALLWSLAAAAKRSVPFPEVLRAMAEDESASVSPFAQRFAEALERGEPLDASARRASLWLLRELHVALAWAGRTGLVDDALEQSLTTERTASREFQRIINVCIYFWVVLLAMAGILTFIMLKIVPVFAKMFQEFQLNQPGPTLLLIDISKSIVESGIFVVPLLGVALLAIGALLLDVNIGLFAQYVPPFSYLLRRYWGAHLLQLLAPALRRGFALQDALTTLAESHPLSFVRNRIAAALRDYQQGQSAWLALARQGLVGSREAAVLVAAERAGNLPWALEEMAESTLRKQVYWMRGWYNVVVPLGVLGLGVVVAFVVVSLLMPLIALIQGLAPTMSGA
jgi:type II secretory pathway component PulF